MMHDEGIDLPDEVECSAFSQGWEAYESGIGFDESPYLRETRRHTLWRRGWAASMEHHMRTLANESYHIH